MKATVVCHGNQVLSGKQYRHGDELPPDVLDGELLDYWLDKRLAVEIDGAERRSLYRLFSSFSGTDCEPEALDSEFKEFAL